MGIVKAILLKKGIEGVPIWEIGNESREGYQNKESIKAKAAREIYEEESRVREEKRTEFLENLYRYISNDEVFIQFFEKLQQFKREIEKKENLDAINDILELMKKLYESVNHTNKLKKDLESSVTITEDTSISLLECPYLCEKETDGYAEAGYYNTTSYYGEASKIQYGTTFNGVYVTLQMLESERNPYQENYESCKARHKNIEEDIKSLEQRIELLKRKKSFFKKNKKMQEIAELEKQLDQTKYLEKLKEKSEIYRSFSEEDKRKIKVYLESVKQSEKIAAAVNYSKTKLSYQNWKEIEINDLLEQAIIMKIITEEELNEIIEKIISCQESNYSSFNNNSLSENLKQIINQFYDNIIKQLSEERKKTEKK